MTPTLNRGGRSPGVEAAKALTAHEPTPLC